MGPGVKIDPRELVDRGGSVVEGAIRETGGKGRARRGARGQASAANVGRRFLDYNGLNVEHRPTAPRARFERPAASTRSPRTRSPTGRSERRTAALDDVLDGQTALRVRLRGPDRGRQGRKAKWAERSGEKLRSRQGSSTAQVLERKAVGRRSRSMPRKDELARSAARDAAGAGAAARPAPQRPGAELRLPARRQ